MPEVLETAPADGGAGAAQEEARVRADLYRLLSVLYLDPPHADLLRQLMDPEILGELSAFLGAEAVVDLEAFANDSDAPTGIVRFLEQDYMGLFVVPGSRYVFPFEDVHLGTVTESGQGRGPLLGVRAVAAKRMYREAGAELDHACKMLPNHVGVELAFMGFLCEREAAANDGNDRYRDLQFRFLNEHLNEWFPVLERMIRTNARSPFYRGLAAITAALLAKNTAVIPERTVIVPPAAEKALPVTPI